MQMKDKTIFFDTNILLYLLSADHKKADRVEQLLSKGGVISVQVLNEFANVASRKLKMTWVEIREILATISIVCDVVAISIAHHDRSFEIVERYGFSFYDSLIISAAQLANCKMLYSEDMHNGQSIDQLLIINPFS